MINLIPPSKKQYFLWEHRRRFLIIIYFFILFFVVSLVLTLFPAEIYLSNKIKLQKVILDSTKTEFEGSEIRDFQNFIDNINLDLIKLEEFYSRKVYFTQSLEKISNNLSEGSYLKNLSVTYSEDDKVFKVSLSGFSPTREMLFEFKNKLEREKDFDKVYFPPSNWVSPQNIDFFTTFEMFTI